jgi:hypothetical protein
LLAKTGGRPDHLGAPPLSKMAMKVWRDDLERWWWRDDLSAGDHHHGARSLTQASKLRGRYKVKENPLA